MTSLTEQVRVMGVDLDKGVYDVTMDMALVKVSVDIAPQTEPEGLFASPPSSTPVRASALVCLFPVLLSCSGCKTQSLERVCS